MNLRGDDVVSAVALVVETDATPGADVSENGDSPNGDATDARGRRRGGGFRDRRWADGPATAPPSGTRTQAETRYCCQAGGTTGAATRMKIVGPGGRGLRRGCIWISTGVRSPLRRLQGAHEVTMFSHALVPPRLRGTTWSTVRWEVRAAVLAGP